MATFVLGQHLVFSDVERMQRKTSYNEEYMEYWFNEEHQKAMGDDLSPLGYPDDGNGRYMKNKEYPVWYFMNVAKRIKNNNTESLSMVAPLSLVNGLFQPYPTIGLLLAYAVGRNFYT